MKPRRGILVHLIIIIAALLVVGGPPLRCEPESPGAHTIPFIVQHEKIVISVRVGSRDLDVLLDTGMQFDGLFLYKQDLKDQLGIQKWAEMGIAGAGAGSSAQAVMAEPVSFTAGDAVFTDQRVVVLQNDSFANFPRDGVIGYSLFGRHAVTIDYDTMTITLQAPGTLTPGEGWQRIPLTFRSNKIPWVDLTVSLEGDAEMSLSAYIDLASREAVELLIFDGMKYELPEGLESYYLGRGVSGDIYGSRGRIARLKLGDFTLKDVTAAFAAAEVRSKQPGAEAVLGNGALRRFNVIFDYSTESLYLRAGKSFEEPFQ